MPPFVLIVADDDGIRRMWSDAFRARGYRVDSALDGQQALDHIAFGVPDVIVGDLTASGVDGPELVRQLRRCGHAVPVVLTGSSAAGVHLRGVQVERDPSNRAHITGAVNLGLASQLA